MLSCYKKRCKEQSIYNKSYLCYNTRQDRVNFNLTIQFFVKATPTSQLKLQGGSKKHLTHFETDFDQLISSIPLFVWHFPIHCFYSYGYMTFYRYLVQNGFVDEMLQISIWNKSVTDFRILILIPLVVKCMTNFAFWS